MELVAVYQSFVWHAVVGYAEMLNDMSEWVNSLLHKSLIYWTSSQNDYKYRITDENLMLFGCL